MNTLRQEASTVEVHKLCEFLVFVSGSSKIQTLIIS